MEDNEEFGASKALRSGTAVLISCWIFGAMFTVVGARVTRRTRRGGGLATPLRCLSAGAASIIGIIIVFTGLHRQD
jgi:hypothetical protein